MSAIASSAPHEFLDRQLRERRVVDQAGRIVLALVLALAAVVFIVAPIQAAVWMQAPFLGTFVEYPTSINRSVSDPFRESAYGFNGQLEQNDLIVAVEGETVTSGPEITRVLRENYEVGDLVFLQVITDYGEGRTEERYAGLGRFPLSTMVTLFVVPYVIGLLYLGIGLWVYRNRRDQPLGRVFLMACASIGIVLATTFDLWTTQTFVRLWSAAIPWAAGMVISFAMIFPTELPVVAERPALRWLPGLLALALMVLIQFQLTGSKVEINLAWRSAYIFAGVGIAIMLGALALRAVFSPSPAVREQSLVVLVGTFLSFVPFILSNLVLRVFDINIAWVLASFLFFPLVIAYSIVQYSVLDTGRWMSFGVTYSIMAVAVGAGYVLLVIGVSFITTAAISEVAANPFLIGLMAFGLVLAFQPARQRLQRIIDDLFFRSRAEYQERLTAFRHELTLASGLAEVVRLLKQQIRETLRPTHGYVFLRDPQSNNFVAAGEGSRPDTDIRFESNSGLVHALSTTRDVIFLELNKPLPPELVEEHARLAVLRTPVLAPLQGQERLAGFVAVGNKRSSENFSIQDLRFVQALVEQASLAVERAQVIGDLERRVRELDVLSQVSQAVNFTTDPDVLMELIYAQTSKLIDTTNFYIITHNPQVKTLSYAFFLEADERSADRETAPWPDTTTLAGEIVRTGRPVLTTDYAAECAFRNVDPGDMKHYAWMGVPLNAGARTLGILLVASYVQGVVFTEEQMKVLWAIADQAASALDKARLFREIETRARQLATLNEISKELSSTLDLEALLVRIMRSAVDILGAEAGSLFLQDEGSGDLVFRVVEGGAQNLVGTHVPAGKGIVGEAATTGQPVIVNNVLQDQRWFSNVDRETAFQTQSLLAVPLRIQDQSIGVVEVINKRDHTAFIKEDAALLTTFAAQAAVAIENARLYEATDAELEARVDELQNLQRIDRELNRTLKYERVVQITLDWALRTTGAAAGTVAMVTQDGTGVEILASSGYTQEFLDRYKDAPIPIGTGIVGRVLASGKPDFSTNLEQEADYVKSTEQASVAQITVPILRANQPIGVLVLETHVPGLLTAQDFEFAQRLVEHAAVAIENARLVGEIESANRSKTEFISFVAHELKNPMTSIRGYTDLLKAGQVGPVSDMQVQFLATIRTNVDRMTRLVSDLADVARIETGHLRLEMSPIAVRSVVDETLRGLQGQIDEKKQQLVVEVPEDLPPIFADHTRMVQVMTNLVSNAHKYTPDGGTIWVGAKIDKAKDEQNGREIEVIHHWVRDTGIGMAPEDLEKLFTKFFRTQRGKDMAPGTGLGLNITKNLVERHNGTIWVESEVGKGTAFHYTVPIATEDMQQASEQAAD